MMNLQTLLRTAKQRQQRGQQLRGSKDSEERKEAEQDAAAPVPPFASSSLSFPVISLSAPRPLSLSDEVPSPYPRCFYVPNWCNEEDEAQMIAACQACPPEHWITLRGRRLQCWGNTPQPPSSSSSPASTPSLPPWLDCVIHRVCATGLFTSASSLLPSFPRPDHVLINHYAPGQGIMAHKDGPAYAPLVAIISLSSSCVMHFYPQPPPSTVYTSSQPSELAVLSVYLAPRSLLLFSSALYTEHYHAIHETAHDTLTPSTFSLPSLSGPVARTVRYSLTVRASQSQSNINQRENPVSSVWN